MRTIHTQKKSRLGIQLLIIIGAFVICFIGTKAVMTMAYGLPYNETMEITRNATESTEGHMIDSYVAAVKSDICPTLNNQTEIGACMNL